MVLFVLNKKRIGDCQEKCVTAKAHCVALCCLVTRPALSFRNGTTSKCGLLFCTTSSNLDLTVNKMLNLFQINVLVHKLTKYIVTKMYYYHMFTVSFILKNWPVPL